MPDHDVIVVGGGPVGMLLACLLAQRGIDVVVCEKRTGADHRTRAIGIHPPGLAALEEAGIGEKVRAEALALEGGDVLSRGRVLARIDFTAARTVHVLPQYRTGALLRERLAHLDPAALRLGCGVVAVRDEEEFIRVTVDSGTGRHELTCAFLVAADGVHSGIRDCLDGGWRRRAGAADYAMMDVPDASSGMRAHLHCEPGGLVESFPLPGGVRRWVVRADASAGKSALTSAHDFRAVIAERTGIRLDLPTGADPVSFHASQHRADRAVRGRVALLGDAAHEISPIGGQGMNLGWLGALRLAEAIETSIRRGGPQLRGVERRSRHAANRAQNRARFYMSMGSPAHGMRLQMREAVIRMLGSAPLRGRTAGMITMDGL